MPFPDALPMPGFVLLAVLADGYELYVAFDPLTEPAQATGIAARVAAWCKAQEPELLALQ